MKKILLLLLISGNLLAGFFDGFIPTPSKMMDFYNQNKSDMLPFFDREKRLESQNADSVMEGDVEYLAC
jgi:hypothetical protein